MKKVVYNCGFIFTSTTITKPNKKGHKDIVLISVLETDTDTGFSNKSFYTSKGEYYINIDIKGRVIEREFYKCD